MRRVTWIDGVKHIQDVVEGDPSLGFDQQEVQEARRVAMICNRYQLKAALEDAGLLAQADTAIQSMTGRQQLAWSDLYRFTRNSQFITDLGIALGLTDTEIDDLFRQAADITV